MCNNIAILNNRFIFYYDENIMKYNVITFIPLKNVFVSVTWSFRNHSNILISYYQCWKQLLLNIFCGNHDIFVQDSLINILKEQHLPVSFDQCNGSLVNKCSFPKKWKNIKRKKNWNYNYWPQTFEYTVYSGTSEVIWNFKNFVAGGHYELLLLCLLWKKNNIVLKSHSW